MQARSRGVRAGALARNRAIGMAALKNGRTILCDLYLVAAEIECFAIWMRALSVLAALVWRLHD